jgi:probable F420-dependent oxidoreductase
MQFGFMPTEGGLRYREALEEARLAERAGFDSVWLAEHHLQREHYWGTPMTALAGFAMATERITLGTNVIVLPFYHPVRVAEDAHLLSIMSGGRFILGVGMGYREDEYRAYGVDVATRGRRYGEALDLLRRLLTEDVVTFGGRYYRVEGAGVQPKSPVPVPLWAGGWGEQNLRRAGQHADEWIPGPTADLDKLLGCRQAFERHRAEAGRSAESNVVSLTRELVIAETDGQAWEDAERYLLPNYRDEYAGGWGHPLFGGGSQADNLRALATDRFIIGGPETVIAGIRHYVERFGANHMVFRLSSATTTHAFVMRELELLAERVLPAFKP